MDQNQPHKVRRNYSNNNGRYYQNNHYHHHSSRGRDYHAASRASSASNNAMGHQDANNNFGVMGNQTRPTFATWKALFRRQCDLTQEKSRTQKEFDKREISIEEQKGKDDREIRNEIGDGKYEENVVGSKGDAAGGEENVGKTATAMSQYDSLMLELEKEKSEITSRLSSKERKLDQDMQRFFQELERYLQLMPNGRTAYEPRYVEQEISIRDQQLAYCHQRIQTLEEKNRAISEELEYVKQITQQLSVQKIQMQQQFHMEKEAAVAKAKSETMGMLVRLGGNASLWQDPFVSSDPKLSLDPNGSGIAYSLCSSAAFHAWIAADSPSPCIQPQPAMNGGNGIMSDLRDRHEDVKIGGYMEKNDKTDRILYMIKKVNLFYEAHDMRVYEELLYDQFVSTLIWCPNDKLCPSKSEASFALGYGGSQLEATFSALTQAYNIVLDIEKESRDGDSNSSRISSRNDDETEKKKLSSTSSSDGYEDELSNKSGGDDKIIDVQCNFDSPKQAETRKILDDSDSCADKFIVECDIPDIELKANELPLCL